MIKLSIQTFVCAYYISPEIYVYLLLFYYHDRTPSPMQLIEERAYLGYGFRGLEYKMAEQRHARRKQRAANLNHSTKQREQTRNSPSLKTLKATSSIVLPPTRPQLLTSAQIVSPTENRALKGPEYQTHFSFKTLQHKKIRLENIIFINFLELKKNIFFLSKTLIAFCGHHLSLGGHVPSIPSAWAQGRAFTKKRIISQ